MTLLPAGTYLFKSTAERYEVSTRSFGAYVGGQAALRWLVEDVTLSFVYDRTSSLRRDLWDALAKISAVELISERHWNGGLLTFRLANTPPESIVETLRQKQIYTRIIDATPKPCVRLSIGFWNRESDVDCIATAIYEMLARS